MIDFNSQAAAITGKLEATITAAKTVRNLGEESRQRNRPAILPAIDLALARADLKDGGNGHYNTRIKWSVLVRTNAMTGTDGALALVDQVLETLTGYAPASGTSPMVPESVEYFNQDDRADVSYILLFSTTASQVAVNPSC
jgi:hypothetical protein